MVRGRALPRPPTAGIFASIPPRRVPGHANRKTRWSTLWDENMLDSFDHLSMSKKITFCLGAILRRGAGLVAPLDPARLFGASDLGTSRAAAVAA